MDRASERTLRGQDCCWDAMMFIGTRIRLRSSGRTFGVRTSSWSPTARRGVVYVVGVEEVVVA